MTNTKLNPRSCTDRDAVLGRLIRLRRNERKMSQSDLGNALGISFQMVQKMEKAINRVSVSRLHQIAAALDTPVSFFQPDEKVDGRDEMQSLLFLDPKFGLRLLRAYSKLTDDVRRHFVTLMEAAAK